MPCTPVGLWTKKINNFRDSIACWNDIGEKNFVTINLQSVYANKRFIKPRMEKKYQS